MISGLMIAPSEPVLLRALGKSSSLPEQFGLDALWSEKNVGGLIGIQRKEISDMLASVQDGRLARELQKIRNVKVAYLVIEGRMRWSTDNRLLMPANYSHLTRAMWRGMLRTCQHYGLFLEFTDDVADTVCLIEEIAKWSAKEDHSLLTRRPNPNKSMWGTVDDEDWELHVLQSIEGIGHKQAKAIRDHFGRLPLAWTVTEKELKGVHGLGPKRIQAMFKGIRAVSEPEVVDNLTGIPA